MGKERRYWDIAGGGDWKKGSMVLAAEPRQSPVLCVTPRPSLPPVSLPTNPRPRHSVVLVDQPGHRELMPTSSI